MAFVLTPSLPIRQWLVQLDKWSRNSPNFFVGRPIILDLAGAAVGVSEIVQLITDLAARGIRIMALEGADANQLGPSLPPLLHVGRFNGGGDIIAAAEGASIAGLMPRRQEASSLLIESPIRSGQSIVFTQQRRDRARLGRFRRRGRCRWVDPCLWRTSRTSHGRLDGEHARTNFLQQERSRAHLHRRVLPCD